MELLKVRLDQVDTFLERYEYQIIAMNTDAMNPFMTARLENTGNGLFVIPGFMGVR
jgi:hypothetical protein